MSIKDELEAMTDKLRGMKADHRQSGDFYRKPKVPSEPRRGPHSAKSARNGSDHRAGSKPLSTERIWGLK